MELVKKYLFLLLVLISSLYVSRQLYLSGYFPMHDDIQVMRLYEMEECFKGGQIPCRWVSNMGGGFGHPLYNYHQVFPYYLGMVFRVLGLSFIDIVKVLFWLTFLLSGVSMYLLGKKLWGEWAGLVASVLFLYAPYRAVDVFVRGALTEIWGIAFFPLIFLSLSEFLAKNKFRWFLLSIFSLTGLFLSHNIMTMLFTPLAVIWTLYWALKLKKGNLFPQLVLIFLFSLGLSAFFLSPAFLEKSLVTMETLTGGYYDFQNHFVTLRQLFCDRSWNYGGSTIGANDGMSFQLGWPHWPLAVFGGVIATLSWLKNNLKKRTSKDSQNYLLSVFLFFFWLLSVFLTHAQSFPVWVFLPIFKYVQFPWRFLGLGMFLGSLLAANLVRNLRGKNYQVIVVVGLAAVVFLNGGYFRPLKILDVDDKKMLSGEEWQRQSLTTLLDYYPAQVKVVPQEVAFPEPVASLGLADISDFKKSSGRWSFKSVVRTKLVKVTVPVFDFPVWQVFLDGKKTEYLTDSKSGLIMIELPAGEHEVEAYFSNTPLRSLANKVSLFSSLVLLLLIILNLYRYGKSLRKN